MKIRYGLNFAHFAPLGDGHMSAAISAGCFSNNRCNIFFYCLSWSFISYEINWYYFNVIFKFQAELSKKFQSISKRLEDGASKYILSVHPSTGQFRQNLFHSKRLLFHFSKAHNFHASEWDAFNRKLVALRGQMIA